MGTTTTTARSGRAGLSAQEAAQRLRRDGPNEVPGVPPPSALRQLAGQFVHLFAVLLWVAAGLALIGGMPQLSVAIVAVLVLNGIFAFVQEHRADRAGERLQALLPLRVTVRRDGRVQDVAARELVRGDRVLLEAGDRVSADLELRSVSALGIDASMLTGETVADRPDVGDHVSAGTWVVEGRAEADVVAVGRSTRLAAIAATTQEARRPVSPLTKQLHGLVRTIARIAVGVGVTFFAVALLLGMGRTDAFLLAVGVTVALVPEGLLPTVTLSLARAAQRMAASHALVRRLEAVETLGATTFVCSDKTGTLTRNEMTVVAVWTPAGTAVVDGVGYAPEGRVQATPAVRALVQQLAVSAVHCSAGRAVQDADGRWTTHGDPMEVALDVLARRLGLDSAALEAAEPRQHLLPFDPRRRRESVVAGGLLHVKGAVEQVLPRCTEELDGARDAADGLAGRGLRVLAVARRPAPDEASLADPDLAERGLVLLGLVAFEDPPRDGVAAAVARCRQAGVRLALVTGDHPATARAIAAEVGLLTEPARVLTGAALPADDDQLGRLLDHDGVVVARVTPEDKLRIARALQGRGHVVAMTGDGVNDGPALREADIGIAMGRSGTDVAREAADLVLLDDAFPTIVTAVELGRATSANLRRFLTYHLTDNVAELAPFVVFALSAGSVPLALTVLMVLALDIGTDLLPALALGAEPPEPDVMDQPPGSTLVDGRLLGRAFAVLGPTEAAVEMAAFVAVLSAAGWQYGEQPPGDVLLAASGAAFAAVVLGQLANAFACRSEHLPAWRLPLTTNGLLLGAVAFELGALAVFLAVPPVAAALELRPPDLLGWSVAALAVPAVLLADAAHKAVLRRRSGAAAGDPTGPAPRPPRRLTIPADRRTPVGRQPTGAGRGGERAQHPVQALVGFGRDGVELVAPDDGRHEQRVEDMRRAGDRAQETKVPRRGPGRAGSFASVARRECGGWAQGTGPSGGTGEQLPDDGLHAGGQPVVGDDPVAHAQHVGELVDVHQHGGAAAGGLHRGDQPRTGGREAVGLGAQLPRMRVSSAERPAPSRNSAPSSATAASLSRSSSPS